MDVFSIIEEPNPYNIGLAVVAAYRQIRLVVAADTLVGPDQPMYADIYFYNYVGGPAPFFYKSLTSYSIDNLGGTNSLFMFDIQDAAQEYLKTLIPGTPAVNFMLESDFSGPYSNIGCTVYFRGSTISAGILTPNPVVPVQGTATTAPVDGTGTPCNAFYILNSIIDSQFETIYNNDLERYLLERKVTSAGFSPDAVIYSLSELPLATYLNPRVDYANKMYREFYALQPMVILSFGVSGILSPYSRNCTLILEFGSNGVMGVGFGLFSVTLGANAYYVPCGIANLSLMPVLSPAFIDLLVNPSNNYYYRLTLHDDDANANCWHSPLFKACTSAIEPYNLWFQNNHGHFESVQFVRNSEQFSTSSASQFVPYTQAVDYGYNNPLQVGQKRYNVRAGNEITLTATFNEALMPWLKELFSSPYVMRQVDGAFKAVKIVDGTIDTKKSVKDGRVNYEVSLKIRPALDYTTQRN